MCKYLYFAPVSFSDLPVKITPSLAGRITLTKGFGYSLSNKARKLNERGITEFAVGAVGDFRNSIDPVVAVLTSRHTIAIEPISSKIHGDAIAKNKGRISHN